MLLLVLANIFSFFPLFPAIMKVCCGAVKTIKGAVALSLGVALICLVAEISRFGTYGFAGVVGSGVGVLFIILWMLQRKMV